jgi:hypothetical protein
MSQLTHERFTHHGQLEWSWNEMCKVYDGLNSPHRHSHPQLLSSRCGDGCDSIDIALRLHHISLILSVKAFPIRPALDEDAKTRVRAPSQRPLR